MYAVPSRAQSDLSHETFPQYLLEFSLVVSSPLPHLEHSTMQTLQNVAPQVRGLATAVSRPALSGLNAAARAKAEQITAQWKGANASGENVKNYIGGKFVDSTTEKWIDLVDPVRILRLPCRTELTGATTVDANPAFTCPRNNSVRI
jgi:hypothetical protein